MQTWTQVSPFIKLFKNSGRALCFKKTKIPSWKRVNKGNKQKSNESKFAFLRSLVCIEEKKVFLVGMLLYLDPKSETSQDKQITL